jgi:hypothetical protein
MTAVIDVWMQHPTPRFIQHDMFDSLRRWTRAQPTEGMQATEQGLPLALTIAAMDAAGVERGLIAAWYGPEGPMITNDDVAGFVAQYPDRLVGVLKKSYWALALPVIVGFGGALYVAFWIGRALITTPLEPPAQE